MTVRAAAGGRAVAHVANAYVAVAALVGRESDPLAIGGPDGIICEAAVRAQPGVSVRGGALGSAGMLAICARIHLHTVSIIFICVIERRICHRRVANNHNSHG